jgi:GAF domain-containing protein/DNA-binding response OmpR family regulator
MAGKSMTDQTHTSRHRARSLRFRIMRLVLPVVMGTFLVFGVLALITVRGGAHDSLAQSHRESLSVLAQGMNSRLAAIHSDLVEIAGSRSVREFARDTLVSLTGDSLQSSQSQVLADFAELLQKHTGDYVAMRYVTYTGSVWTEVTSYTGSAPQVDNRVRLNEMAADATLSSALGSMLSEVTVSDIDFLDREGRFFQQAFPYIRFSTPVAAENDLTNITGVIQLDVAARPLLDALQTEITHLSVIQPERQMLLVDHGGRVIASSSVELAASISALTRDVSPTLESQFPNIDRFLASQARPANRASTNALSNLAVSVAGYILSTAEIGSPGSLGEYWRLLLIDNAGLMQGYANSLSFLSLAVSLIIGLVICAVIYVILGQALKPVGALARQWSAETSGTGSAAAQRTALEAIAPYATEDDEIGQLVTAFHRLARHVDELQAKVESQYGSYTRNLDLTARIGHETAALHDTELLLNRAINLICEEFGFDHAQVYLIDEVSKNAVLAYSHGASGQKLLEQKHRVLIGSRSIVGRVAAYGEPLIVNDVTQLQEAESSEALLPQTQAQMVLPMYGGDQMIGALDIQSGQRDRFREEELRTFQLLANQIAIAVQNARLLLQSQERVQQIDTLNRQLIRTAWEDVDTYAEGGVYHYDLMKVEKGDGVERSSDDKTLSVPISIRGEVIGTLDALPEARGFSENDQIIMRAVADRVAIAIESARLFEETQNSLTETSTLYQLSRYLSEAETLNDIIRAIIVSVMPDATGGQIGVFELYDPGTPPVSLEISTDWTLQEHGPKEVRLDGIQLRVADHRLLREMAPNQITLVQNAARDRRLDDIFQAILHDIGAQAMVLIPFSVRSVWRGVILIEFAQPREFSEREGRIYTALIDQAGVTIDNRMLLQQNELALAQIERLYSASRIINMSQTMQDLVSAAVTTSIDPELNFELAVLEGDLDDTGWPTHLRRAAFSRGNEVFTDSEVHEISIPLDSPLRARNPQIIAERSVESSIADFVRAQGYHFGAVFPLFSANQVIALFFITAAEARDFTSEDYEVYRALTGQMSTVLQNRRLLEQTEVALDETRRLYAASREVTSAVNAEGVYEAAGRYLVIPATATHQIAVLMAGPSPTPEAPYVECAYLWTRNAEASLKFGDQIDTQDIPFVDLLGESGGTLYLTDVRREPPSYAALRALLERNRSGSAVITPIRTRQRWFGVLLIEAVLPHAFDAQYVRFTQALADQMAVALEGLLLFQEAQTQAQRALALAEAGQLASRIGAEFARSITEVFARVTEAAEYDRWLLALLDESGARLQRITYHNPILTEPDISGEVSYEVNGENAIAEAFRADRLLLINDPGSYPSFASASAETLEQVGKNIIVPVRSGLTTIGVLAAGRALTAPDLDETDEQLIQTLAAQVSVAVENRRLFLTAEGERERLRSILATLPAGVLVLDPKTFKPIQNNERAEYLLGRAVDMDAPFASALYNIVRTGTNSIYPDEDLPIYLVAQTGKQSSSDDIAIGLPDGSEIDLLINAAPIVDAAGEMSAIVAAFQDITALRSLENSLQQNLRETIALYETTRAVSEAEEADDVVDEIVNQFVALEVSDVYVVFVDDQQQTISVARSLSGVTGEFPLPRQILEYQEAQFVGSLTEATLNSASISDLAMHGIAAYASMPMRARSRRAATLGWIVLTFDTPQDFTPERIQFLTTLNDTAAAALDNRYLFRSTEDALQETAALYGATTTISAVRDLAALSSALEDALTSLSPDAYAAYIRPEGKLVELFNIDLDGAATRFAELIERHHLFEQGRGLYLDDARALSEPTAFERDLRERGNIGAFGLIPLRAQGQAGGCLLVAYHRARRFTKSDMRYLSAVADSASVVFDNILLLDQIQSALQETSILYQASRALSDTGTAAGVLGIVTDFLTERPITLAFIAVLNTSEWTHEHAAVQIAASWQPNEEGLHLQGITLTAGQFPAWRLLATHSVLTIDDVTTAALDPAEVMAIQSLQVRSISILPLRVAGQALGAIVLGAREPYEHSDRDLRIYRSFAEQASLRLEAARLLSQTERRARQLATSAQVSQIASSILDLNMLMPRIVELIRESFSYDHVQIFLMDDEQAYAELRASTGEAGRQLLSVKHRLQKGSRSVIGQVTATGEPVIATDTADAQVVHRPNPYLPQTRSEMAIPLKLKGQVVGALDVQSNQPNVFDADDVAVLTTLAAQISVAIDNAELFEQSRRRASEMGFLFDVTTVAAAAETLNDALQNVANELRVSLDALSVSMYLPETYRDIHENTVIRMRPVALAGTDQPLSELSEVQLDVPNNAIATSASQRRPIIIGSMAAEPDYLPVAAGARSAILVPLTSGTELVGLISVESELLNAYNQDTLTLLLTLSGTLSAIVQNQKLLEQVQKTNEQLRELDRLKSDFLANMSHELRTPLNSIIGFSRVILKGIDGPLTEMQEQDLSTIYSSGLHLLNLINDILDQAKIAAGKMDLQFVYFEMKSVIDGVRSIGIGLVRDKPIDIFVEIAPGLVPAYGDEFRTRQVLLNLVSNAAKFTREGSITIRSYPVMDSDSGMLMLRTDVIDTGIGIAEQDQPLLFEAFRQVDSSLTRTVGGTGLGLPIAKSLIEMQGGKMLVQSQVNFGSTFSIVMPTEPVTGLEEGAQKQSVVSLPSVEAKKPAGSDNNDTGVFTSPQGETNGGRMYVQPVKRQILLIEDNPDMVDQFRRSLQREGYDIYNASIPLEAEAMASGLHPTLIVMDVNFNHGVGWEILERLKQREDTCDIPVVIVSLSQEVERAIQLGISSFVRRPFTPDELIEAVHNAERESHIERILIIDDQPESIRLLQQMLDTEGKYRVFTATSGMDGISLVARRRPNLILLDLRMPDMDGFQVIQELRSNPETASIPIVVVTGASLSDDELKKLHELKVLYKLEMDEEGYRKALDEVHANNGWASR